MTTESDQAQWTVAGLLDLFDVEPAGDDTFVGKTGIAAADERQVVEGTQVLAQAIVAVAKRFPEKSVRSAYAVFARAVVAGPPVEFAIDVVAEGRSTATAIVNVTQNGKRCITVTAFTDVPSGDVIRHHLPRPDVAAPAEAIHSEIPTRSVRQSCSPGCTTTPFPRAPIWRRRSSRTSLGTLGFRLPCGRTKASVPPRRTSRFRRRR